MSLELAPKTESWKTEAWKAALKFVNVPYARKGTKSYDAVMERYRTVELKAHSPPHVLMWQFACQHYAQQDYISAADPRYPSVSHLYRWMKAQVDAMQDPFNLEHYTPETETPTQPISPELPPFTRSISHRPSTPHAKRRLVGEKLPRESRSVLLPPSEHNKR